VTIELERIAESLLALARTALTEQRATETETLLESAIGCARAAAAMRTLADAERLAARVAYAAGDLDRAAATFVSAASHCVEAGDPLGANRLHASAAFVAYDRGDAGAAMETLDRVDAWIATRPADDAGAGGLSALITGYRGNLARQSGALDEARAIYRRALTCAEENEAAVPLATFSMDLGAADLADGRPTEAIAWLARSERAVARVSPHLDAPQLLSPLIAHYRALARLALGDVEVEVEGEGEGAPALRGYRVWLRDRIVAERIDGALERRLVRLEASAETEHARLSARIVRRLVRAPRSDVVLVARDGSSIVRGTTFADIGSREALRRILERLARARAEDPDCDLAIDDLVAAGWPGERIQARAARNRAHVALSTLRALGLGAALVRTRRGYRLDPRASRVG
jgi:tetratricopeptide (TPR) repeat protein